jgi:uncharacterized protein (TIGR02265 family)
MQFERRVSGRFVQWLFGTARGEPVASRLREEGLDLEQIDADYPAEKLSGWLTTLSTARHPTLAPGEALRRIGYEAAHKTGKRASLSQAMTQLPEKLELLGNFFDVSVHPAGEHRYVAHFDDVAALPTFFQGVLEGVTSISSTAGAEVVWSPSGLSGARYVVKAG